MNTGKWMWVKQRHHTVAIYLILLMHQFSNWFPPDDEQTDEQAERRKRQTLSANSEQGHDSAQKSVLHFICQTHWTLNCLLSQRTYYTFTKHTTETSTPSLFTSLFQLRPRDTSFNPRMGFLKGLTDCISSSHQLFRTSSFCRFCLDL